MSASQDDFEPPPPGKKRERLLKPPTSSRERLAAAQNSQNDFESSDSDDDIPLSALKAKTSPQKVKKEGKKKKKKKKKDKKAKRKRREEEAAKRKRSKSRGSSGSSSRKPAAKKRKPANKGPKVKTLSNVQIMDTAMKAYRWWEAPKLPDNQAWRNMEHYGVNFPAPYVPHNVKMRYDGRDVDLTPAQEEVATFYAEMPLDGPQLGDPKTKKVFDKNFFNDFKKYLGSKHTIKNFNKCDFGPIRTLVNERRAARKARTKEEKEVEKQQKLEVSAKYAYAIVDNHIEKLGNFTIEPPGLFRGRGAHPKTGTLKTRVQPEQVILNVGDTEMVPKCHVPGHSWGTLVEKKDVTWLATWNENVMNGTKYVWLAASSSFKGRGDLAKYEKARKLKKHIVKIRADYERNLKKKTATIFERQRATAMWVIDRLALRAGNEKDEDEADTVGTCSLRVEHLHFDDSGKDGQSKYVITLDFLGKDSMRHLQTIDLGTRYGDVGINVFNNLKKFCSRKKDDKEIFNELSVGELNDHLKELMPGLSAKVFRTYNASNTLENELPDNVVNESIGQKVILYNEANRKVAILCNHQKTVSKAFNENMEKMGEKVEIYKQQIEELKTDVRRVRKGKEVKLAKDTTKMDKMQKFKQSHRFKRQPSEDQVRKKLATLEQRLKTFELQMKNKDDNKSVALGTSKINYMDPRVTVAWCKRNECPIDKVFARALRDKFPWAMGTTTDYKF